MEALRELRGRPAILRAAETPEEAHKHLEAHVIHPGFYDGPASALATEFVRDVLKLDPLNRVTLWALYTEAACSVLERLDTLPVPSYSSKGNA